METAEQLTTLWSPSSLYSHTMMYLNPKEFEVSQNTVLLGIASLAMLTSLQMELSGGPM